MRYGPTTTYKIIHVSVMISLTAFMVSGAFYLRANPYFQNKALIALTDQVRYTIAYATSDVPASAALQDGVSSDEKRGEEEAPAQSIPVLVLHGVVAEPDGSTINLTQAQFKDYLFTLKKAGYKTITLAELERYVRGEEKIPPKRIVITFDDGRSDSYYHGDPVLAAVGYQAVMFVIASYAEEAELNSYYLSEDELRMMVKTGRWEVGSHSDKGHVRAAIDARGRDGNFFSNHLWLPDEGRQETESEFETRIDSDLASSRSKLESLFNQPITTFAFPYGDFGQNQRDSFEKMPTIRNIAAMHYDQLFYQYSPGEYYSQVAPMPQVGQNSLFIKRIDIDNSWSSEDLMRVLERGTQKALPYTDTFDADSGWVQVWGEPVIRDGAMELFAKDHQSGVSAILDGSQTWTDYTVTANVTSLNQTGVLLWARFTNDGNNVACNLGNDFAHVEEVVNGQHRVVRGVRTEAVIPEGPFTVTMTVDGRSVRCAINGEVIVETEFLNPSLTTGGIGIKVWDQELGRSRVVVEELSVNAQ